MNLAAEIGEALTVGIFRDETEGLRLLRQAVEPEARTGIVLAVIATMAKGGGFPSGPGQHWQGSRFVVVAPDGTEPAPEIVDAADSVAAWFTAYLNGDQTGVGYAVEALAPDEYTAALEFLYRACIGTMRQPGAVERFRGTSLN